MNYYPRGLLILLFCQSQLALGVEPSKAVKLAGEFVVDTVADSPRVYADVCTLKNPAMKADFERALAEHRAKVQAIAKPLLALEQFGSLNHDHAPQQAVDSVTAQTIARREMLKDADPARDCPVFLSNMKKMDDVQLKAGLTHSLTGMLALIAGLKEGAVE